MTPCSSGVGAHGHLGQTPARRHSPGHTGAHMGSSGAGGTLQELGAWLIESPPAAVTDLQVRCVRVTGGHTVGELHGDAVTESRGSVLVAALVLTCKSPSACLVGHEQQMIY